MKKNFVKLTLVLFLIFITYNIFVKTNNVTSSIKFSIDLFYNNIFPSLFPMFIITSFFTSTGFFYLFNTLFNNIFVSLFKTKGIASYVVFTSMLSGFPSSGKTISELLDKKIINNNDAAKILNFTFFANPLFVINTVGIMFLNNKKIGIIIYISHVLGNFITGILFRDLYNTTAIHTNKINLKSTLNNFISNLDNTNIIKDFLENISKVIITLLNVFALITCFTIFTNLIELNVNQIINALFKGLIEQTSGLKYLAISSCSYNIKVYTSCFLISFGGFCIHLQIFNFLSKYKIKYYPFFISRIIHASISTLLTYIFINL